ncbi:MAG TPA: hypothetical protein VEV37_06000 [Bryobacteraceae bacterium]|nr:hypothetical protein [Bryobacteraceae bacterium]
MVPGTHRCMYCRKKIGAFRRLFDAQFCSADHRRKLTSGSARALRDAEDLYGAEEVLAPTWSSITQLKRDEKEERKGGLGPTLVVAFGVVLLMFAIAQMRQSAPPPKAVSSAPKNKPSNDASSGGIFGVLGNLVQSTTSSKLRDDFRAGLGNWEGRISDWTAERGEVRPGSLRIYKPSASLSNYQMDFMGQIERKSMNWAFRAADTKNYYATKLVITHPGPLPNAGLVRFIVLDGRERERVELPLPLTLERGVDYHVQVTVQGKRFLTSVNGQLVSSWTDDRISRGGVGFFADSGESSVVKWVTVSERDSFLSKIASHFSLITFPAVAIPGAR